MVLAGVDIGTLTCRLLIARVSSDGRLAELHSERRILRLGEGLGSGRTLLPSAVERVIETLRDWRKALEIYHVDGEAAVATSAVREAANREEFLARAKLETGFDVAVLTGVEEARMTMLGIRSGLPSGIGAVLGLDIGGGSTEFILDCPGRPPVLCSVELGVVRLTERLFMQDPPAPEELQTARELIREHLERICEKLGNGDPGRTTLVGTAGTITTLAAMALRLPYYEGARIHNYALALKTVRELEHELLSRTKAERAGLPGLEPGREDVIVAGSLILRGVMEDMGFAECLVSDLGLREGIVLDLAARLAPMRGPRRAT